MACPSLGRRALPTGTLLPDRGPLGKKEQPLAVLVMSSLLYVQGVVSSWLPLNARRPCWFVLVLRPSCVGGQGSAQNRTFTWSQKGWW